MTRRRVLAMVLTVALGAGLVACLGPRDVAWTARAAVARGGPEPWGFLAPDSPLALSCDVRGLFSSEAIRATRPRIDEIAAALGARIGRVDAWVGRAAWSPGLAVGGGVRAAPGFLALFGRKWTAFPEAGRGAVTDGSAALVPLEPGLVLWCESAGAAADGLATARQALASGGLPALALADGGANLRVRVVPDEDMRREAARSLPAELSFAAFDVESIALDATAGSRLAFDARIALARESSASRLEALLRQADVAARLVRSAGAVAALLGGERVALLADVPPLAVAREDRVVTVRGELGPEELDRLLARGLAEITPGTRRAPRS